MALQGVGLCVHKAGCSPSLWAHHLEGTGSGTGDGQNPKFGKKTLPRFWVLFLTLSLSEFLPHPYATRRELVNLEEAWTSHDFLPLNCRPLFGKVGLRALPCLSAHLPCVTGSKGTVAK